MKKVVALFVLFSAFAAISASAQQNKVVVVPLSSSNGVGAVVTTEGGSAWLPYYIPPTTVDRYVTGTAVSGDGRMVLGVNAPASFNGVEYGLESVEICVNVTAPGYLNYITIYKTASATSYPQIFTDPTDRTVDGCYTYPVGASIGKGIGIVLNFAGGGTIRIEGTTFTWKQTSELTPAAPGGAAPLEVETDNR